MADNTVLNPGSGGDTIRTLDDGSVKWPAGVTAYATTIGTPDVLQIVTPSAGLPVKPETGATFTVTVSAALPAGTNNIGDVDVLTVPAPLNVTGGGTEATALRVTLANDSTGVVSVDDNGGSLTVDGTVTANAGTGTFAVDQANAAEADYDTGAGTVNQVMFGVALPGAGGPVAGGTATNPIRVDPTGSTTQPVSGTVTANAGTGTFQVALAAAVPAGTNLIGKLNVVDLAGDSVADETNNALRTSLVVALPAGTNNIGDVDVLTVPAPLNLTGGGAEASALRVTIANDSTGLISVDDNGSSLTVDGDVGVLSKASGGFSAHKLISAASTNATNVKSSAGTLYAIVAFNLNASPRYLKLYNKSTAPTVGTDTPIWTLMIPGNTAGAGFVVALPPQGLAFSTGIGFALTTGIGDADTGAVAANEIVVNLGYA